MTESVPDKGGKTYESLTFTGKGIELYQLAVARSAIKLEKVGLKHSSGRSARKMWAVELGLKPTAKADEVLAALDERIAKLKAEIAQEGGKG